MQRSPAGMWCGCDHPPQRVSGAPQHRCSATLRRCATPTRCQPADAPPGSPPRRSHRLTTHRSLSSSRAKGRARRRGVRRAASVSRAQPRDRRTSLPPPQGARSLAGRHRQVAQAPRYLRRFPPPPSVQGPQQEGARSLDRAARFPPYVAHHRCQRAKRVPRVR